MSLLFRKHSDIKIMPIRAAVWYHGGTDWTSITLLGKESTFAFTPVMRSHYKGGELTLGYLFEATLVIDQNDYANNGLIAKMESIRQYVNYESRVDFQIMLGDKTVPGFTTGEAPYEAPFANGELWIDLFQKATTNWRIEYVEKRPRMVVTVKGFYKTPGEDSSAIFS